MCILSIMEISNRGLTDKKYGIFQCYGISSHGILWSFLTMKIYMHFFCAMYRFIRLLLPSMEIQVRTQTFLKILLVTIPVSGIMAFIPHVFKKKFDIYTGHCETSSGFYASGTSLVLLRVQILFGLMYCFYLPMFGSMYMYRNILRILKMNRNIAKWRQVRTDYILDILLTFLTALPVRTVTFIVLYCGISLGPSASKIINHAVYLMQSYTILYPVLCILFKKRINRVLRICLCKRAKK
ncbi:unnamed protein product [Calicophoron daubneyi]